MSGYLSVSEAARRLGICDDTCRDLFDHGLLAGYRTDTGIRRVQLDGTPPEEHLSISAAARILGLSKDTVRARFDEGRLAGYRLPSGQRRIAVSALTRSRP